MSTAKLVSFQHFQGLNVTFSEQLAAAKTEDLCPKNMDHIRK